MTLYTGFKPYYKWIIFNIRVVPEENQINSQRF